MATIEAFTYNGETDMLRLHLAMQAQYVDHFFIVESRKTFTGYDKPLYFYRDKFHVQPWMGKITYHVVNDDESDYWEMARKSPNTQGAEHWKREFVQKESIRDALRYIPDSDTVIIGDVDELVDYRYKPTRPIEKLKLRVYAYYLDNRSSEEFWGPIVGKWGSIKGQCLNHLRSDVSLRNQDFAGWHFTSQGGYAEFKRKLADSYTAEDYYNDEVRYQLPLRHINGQDFLGRDFIFKTDESEWPAYLKKNRHKYAHLCKGISKLVTHRHRLPKKIDKEEYYSEIGDIEPFE